MLINCFQVFDFNIEDKDMSALADVKAEGKIYEIQ